MSNVRVRIAPSPTGYLHVGTARTALFNYLFAQKNNGKFILRIEDTDLERSDPKFEKDIFDGLNWLGIFPDESPEIGGQYTPYRQSERINTYREALEILLQKGRAFYCFHTEEELEKEKRQRQEMGVPLYHICEDWRDMPLEKANKKLLEGDKAIIRFKISQEISNEQITTEDAIRGQLHSFIGLLGDFSIAKSLDVPLYNFAVVIDDYNMKISHVIRGEDHIPNTPKQLLIAEALGWTKKSEDGIGNTQAPWKYAHLPLILGPDRSKLSKRHGATSIIEYKEQGYLPEALFNFLALIGWNPGDEQEIFPNRDDLIEKFDIEKVHKSGAIFDITKLDWMNGEYIRMKSLKELAELCQPFLKNIPDVPAEYLEKIIALEQPRLKKLSEIGERIDYFFQEQVYDKELLRWKGMGDEALLKSLDRSINLLQKLLPEATRADIERVFLEDIGTGDKGGVLWPLRAALTGKKASPGPFEIIEVMGKEKAIQRLEAAKRLFTPLEI